MDAVCSQLFTSIPYGCNRRVGGTGPGVAYRTRMEISARVEDPRGPDAGAEVEGEPMPGGEWIKVPLALTRELISCISSCISRMPFTSFGLTCPSCGLTCPLMSNRQVKHPGYAGDLYLPLVKDGQRLFDLVAALPPAAPTPTPAPAPGAAGFAPGLSVRLGDPPPTGSALWAGCPGTTLSFSAGDTYTVKEVGRP